MNSYRYETSWGVGLLSCNDDGQLLAHRPPYIEGDVPGLPLEQAPDRVRRVADSLAAYFSGKSSWPLAEPSDVAEWLDERNLPPFLARVLHELSKVPYGHSVSYAELAARAGRPGAARAAGSACARNPLPILVPCHRVLPTTGLVGAYSAAGGSSYKERLLQLENVAGWHAAAS